MKSPLQTREIPLIKTDGLQIKRFRQRVEDGFNKLCIQNLAPMQEFEIVNILRGYGEIKAF